MARPRAGEELDTVPFGDGRRPQSVWYLMDGPGAMEAQGEGDLLPDEGQVKLGRLPRGGGFGIE